MRTSAPVAFLFALALSCASGCSMEQVDARWEDWVQRHNECELPQDCVLVYPGCPLGCYSAVNAEHEEDAYRVADELVRQWSMGTRGCAYDCISAEVDCVDLRCEVIPTEDY